MATTKHLLSTAEVAAEVNRTHTTISRWVRAGKLRPVAEGEGIRGARFFRRSDVERIKRELDRNRAA